MSSKHNTAQLSSPSTVHGRCRGKRREVLHEEFWSGRLVTQKEGVFSLSLSPCFSWSCIAGGVGVIWRFKVMRCKLSKDGWDHDWQVSANGLTAGKHKQVVARRCLLRSGYGGINTLFYDSDMQTTDVSEEPPLESLQPWHKNLRL